MKAFNELQLPTMDASAEFCKSLTDDNCDLAEGSFKEHMNMGAYCILHTAYQNMETDHDRHVILQLLNDVCKEGLDDAGFTPA